MLCLIVAMCKVLVRWSFSTVLHPLEIERLSSGDKCRITTCPFSEGHYQRFSIEYRKGGRGAGRGLPPYSPQFSLESL